MLVKVTLNKCPNGQLRISSENNIDFKRKNNVIGAQPYDTQYSEGCGPKNVTVSGKCKCEVKTLANLVKLCRKHKFKLELNAPEGNSIVDLGVEEGLETYLMVTPEEMINLCEAVNKEVNCKLE